MLVSPQRSNDVVCIVCVHVSCCWLVNLLRLNNWNFKHSFDLAVLHIAELEQQELIIIFNK